MKNTANDIRKIAKIFGGTYMKKFLMITLIISTIGTIATAHVFTNLSLYFILTMGVSWIVLERMLENEDC